MVLLYWCTMMVPSVSVRAVSVSQVGSFLSFVHFELSGAWELAIPDHASRVSSAIASVRKAFIVSSHFFWLSKVNYLVRSFHSNAAEGSPAPRFFSESQDAGL